MERVAHLSLCSLLSFTYISFVFSYLSLILHSQTVDKTLLYKKMVDKTRATEEEELIKLQEVKQKRHKETMGKVPIICI